MQISYLLLLAAILGLSTIAASSAEPSTPKTKNGRPFLAVPAAKISPKITAELADPAWQQAVSINTLVNITDGKATTPQATPQTTTVKMLWDKEYLYVRFICEDTDIYSPFEGRDAPYYKADVVEIFLDTVGDGKEYIELEVSPTNGIFDQYITCTDTTANPETLVLTRFPKLDLAWKLEGIRTAAASEKMNETTHRWIVDIAIPAKAVLTPLKLTEFQPMTMRANLVRYDYPLINDERQLVTLYWAPVTFGCPHISPAAMGFLELMAPVKK